MMSSAANHVIAGNIVMATSSSSSFSEYCYYGNDDNKLNTFAVLMGIWIPVSISVFGIIGNLLSLWVLSRDPEGSITFTSLKALAVCDIVFLVSVLPEQVITTYCYFECRTDYFCIHLAGYLRLYTWPVSWIAYMASIWSTVLISAERFVAICTPLRAPRPGENHKIRWLVAIIATASVIFNIPRFFEFTTNVAFNLDLNLSQVVLHETSIHRHAIYRYFYTIVLHSLVVYVLPLLILTYLNVRLVMTLNKAKRNWRFLNTNQKKEVKATKLPLVIVAVFFVSGTVSFLGFILEAVFDGSQRLLLVYYVVVSNVLVILNSAINFLLMLFFGQKFRSLLSDALCCRRTQTRQIKTKTKASTAGVGNPLDHEDQKTMALSGGGP